MNETMGDAGRELLLTQMLAGRFPDERGRYGPFGGRYVPETLVGALERLEQGVQRWLPDAKFRAELDGELRNWVGRPTALTHAPQLSARWGADVWLKREDLAHTGANKINNAIGQALLAKRLGARRIVAETGAGQHGVASAAACARVGLPCTVYMGVVDMERQAPNVGRMQLFGARVVGVTSGDRTLRAAIDEAMRDWVADPVGTYYLLGSAVGAKAIGLFHPFLGHRTVQLIGVEAGGSGDGLGQNAATLVHGRPGVLHGSYSLLLQDADGQIQETQSVSAGLDYPGVGPEHALLRATGRVQYESASDEEALAAVSECCTAEGILPALESAHALSGAKRWALKHPGRRVLIGLSGRGDKDLLTLTQTVIARLAEPAR